MVNVNRDFGGINDFNAIVNQRSFFGHMCIYDSESSGERKFCINEEEKDLSVKGYIAQ
jgi:hypothetical protein